MARDSGEKAVLIENGYFTSPRVIDDTQVARLRSVCQEYFARTGNIRMLASEFLAIPELAVVPFQPSVVKVLKAFLGDDYVTVPEFTMQTDQFGGWHTDAGNQGHLDHLYRSDYVQIQCGIYLQDNSPDLGGGLDVVPRSHRELLSVGSSGSTLRRAVRRANTSLRKPISIWSKAGDLVGFHFRLRHKATARVQDGPPKYAIFFVAAAKREDAEKYMSHLATFKDEYYCDLGRLAFPGQYPPQVVELISQQNLQIAAMRTGSRSGCEE